MEIVPGNQNQNIDFFFREQQQGGQIPSHTAVANVDGSPRISKNEWTCSVKKGKSKKILIRKTKRGGKRSAKSRANLKHKYEKLSIMGNNCFGLKAKKKSLLQAIKAFNFPSFITLQETKMRKIGSMKINEYQIFEKVRPSFGGGLLTAIKQSLKPVLISPCNDEADILVVQCQVNELKIRVINGYGPQEGEQLSNRLNFWNSLDVRARNNCC